MYYNHKVFYYPIIFLFPTCWYQVEGNLFLTVYTVICDEERRVFKACFCSGSARGFFGLLCVWLFWMFGYQTTATVCLYTSRFAIGEPLVHSEPHKSQWYSDFGSQQKRRCSNKLRYVYVTSLTHSWLSFGSIRCVCRRFRYFFAFCIRMWANVNGVAQWRGSGAVQGRRHSLMGVGGRKLRFRHQFKSTQLHSQCSLGQFAFWLVTRQRQRQRQLQLKPRGRSIQVSSILR